MFDSFQPQLLCPDFEQYLTEEAHDELVRQCRDQVIEWRWATDDMTCKEPFLKEQYGRIARWLKDGARPKPENLRHGIDCEGVIRVVEDPWDEGKLSSDPEFATYLIYNSHRVDAVTYRYGGFPARFQVVRRSVIEGNHLVREHFLNCTGIGSEKLFMWDGSRLERTVSMGWKQRYNSQSRTWQNFEATSHMTSQYEYDELGRLGRIVQRYLNEDGSLCEDISPQIKYQRPQKSESLRSISKSVEQQLLELIPTSISKSDLRGPIYCVLICYCEEDFPSGWPPFLVIGSETERQKIVNAGESVPYFLWAPDLLREHEGNVEIPLSDEILNNYCRLHSQLMSLKNDYSAGKKILQNIAKALNKLDWSAIAEVTNDFIVAIVDNTGEVDFAKDIKGVIPSANFRALRQQGLL